MRALTVAVAWCISSAASAQATDVPPGAALGEPAALELRTTVLEELLAADASSASEARTFEAVIGFGLGVVGLGAAPLLFALDDGTGLLPLTSVVTVQLGALGLTTGILAAGWPSAEERRYHRWSRLRAERTPRGSDLARFEGLLLADAGRAEIGRLFSIGQSIASVATGLYTGLAGIFVTRIEEIQILMGTLGGVELLLGLVQLIASLSPTDIERRPSEYEIRTGVQITWTGTGVTGTF